MKRALSRQKMVYLVLIVLLLILLLFQQLSGGSQSPRLPDLEEEVDELLIEHGGERLEIVRSGEEWLIGEERLPGDGARIEGLVEKIGSLKLLEEVAVTDYLVPYRLGEGEAIAVELRTAGERFRRVLIGKIASSGRQTYLRFEGEEVVYLAAGNLRRDFEIGAEDLRDKEILALDPGRVSRLLLRERGTAGEELVRTENGWTGTDLLPVDQERVADYLNNFAPLRAAGFPREVVAVGEPLFTVQLEADGENIRVEILSPGEDGDYLARSSASPYLFSLSAFKAEQLMKSLSAQ